MLQGVKKADHALDLNTNAGALRDINMEGRHEFFQRGWLDQDAITNVVSFYLTRMLVGKENIGYDSINDRLFYLLVLQKLIGFLRTNCFITIVEF